MESRLYQDWFDSIYESTYPTLRRCAYSFVKIYPDLKFEAEDLIQETYLKLYKKREDLYERDQIVKWLVSTLHKSTQNRLRTKYTQIKHNAWDIDRDDVFSNVYADPYAVVDDAFLNENREQMDKLKSGIGEDKLEMLQEYYLDKTTLQELADREGITPEAMKMRISRLRKKCIEILTIILLLFALLFERYLHIGGEDHGEQYAQKVLFGTRSAVYSSWRDRER